MDDLEALSLAQKAVDALQGPHGDPMIVLPEKVLRRGGKIYVKYQSRNYLEGREGSGPAVGNMPIEVDPVDGSWRVVTIDDVFDLDL